MKVVIIDSGFNLTFENKIHVKNVKGRFISVNSNGETIFSDDYSDNIGHGTMVTNILLQNLTANIDLFIIKIFDKSLSVNVDLLVRALSYCEENLDCNLIQISLGSLYSEKKLRYIIDRLVEKDIVIISAFDNEQCLSYPAAYENVIGVDITKKHNSIHQYDVIENNVIDIQGADIYYRTEDQNNKKSITRGSSFYCSYITAQIVNSRMNSFNKQKCMNFLKIKACNVYSVINKAVNYKKLLVKNAIVFPFNKEIHSLAAFEHLLNFHVVGYYDIRQKGLINSRICDILRYTSNRNLILNFENIDWNGDFDTCICGHVGEISKILGYDFLSQIVELCHTYKKQLICFDNILYYQKKYPNLCAWFPYIDQKILPDIRFGKLRSPNVPIVGVFGTSSCQGKMTIQLFLRESLMKKKIKVKNIGSEPESCLLGFEKSYVFGYESTDLLSPNEMIMALNEMVYDLEQSDCELIIVGSQSGTVANQLRNICMIPFKQYCFLLGTQPDSIILCINGYDSDEYVERTIAFFSSAVNAKVICLVVSNLNANKNNFLVKPSSYFEKKFGIPAVDLMQLDIEKVCSEILQYYGR